MGRSGSGVEYGAKRGGLGRRGNGGVLCARRRRREGTKVGGRCLFFFCCRRVAGVERGVVREGGVLGVEYFGFGRGSYGNWTLGGRGVCGSR